MLNLRSGPASATGWCHELGSEGFGSRVAWSCKRDEIIYFCPHPITYHAVYDQMAPLSNHLGHPAPGLMWKNVHFIMSRVLSSGKAGHLKSFVLIPHLPFSQLWLATGNTIQQVQLIKPWTSRRDCQMLLWTKPYLMDQRVGKGVKRTIAFPGALKDSRDFWRSKFPKRVWINLLHASKQSQWECLILTPLALCHFPCSQQNQQTVTMKYGGCRNTWNT